MSFYLATSAIPGEFFMALSAFRVLELRERKGIEGVGKKTRFQRVWKYASRV